MQDACGGSWIPESQVPPGMLVSVRELNHRFLDLVGSRTCAWNAAAPPIPDCVAAQVAHLSAAQRAAASACPYALFDVRFHDDGHWQTRLRAAASWSIGEAAVDSRTLEFVRLALFFAWHVASSTKLAPQLLLGMQESTAAAFRGALAAAEAVHLTARWNDCARYWSALTGAAAGPDGASLRRIQLYGLQLAAVARLS